MKPINFQSLFLPLNAAITGIVFFLLFPTTRIYASWFPDKKNELWLLPASIVLVSSALWLLGSLSTPFLIRTGIFEERRRGPRPDETARRVRVFKASMPVLSFFFHMILLIALCMSVISAARARSEDKSFKGVAWNYVWR